ncbi:MAG: hypothetical protein IKN25_05645, partial [Spirochaetales bacterium]|nr:hypothetical protein [Spirochaetales bacterium]
MTKVSKNIAKSIMMIMVLMFSVWACSNENVISTAQQIIENGGTDIYDFDTGKSHDGKAAALLIFDGTEYGAELYEVTAVCLSDKQISNKTLETTGSGTIFELPVGKYKFTVVGKDVSKANTYCVGTVTLTLDDEIDITAYVSFVAADNSTKIEYSAETEEGFLFEFVDTLCVGETKNVQLTAGDNWFGLISASAQTLYLSCLSSVSIQDVKIYQDGRVDSSKITPTNTQINSSAT